MAITQYYVDPAIAGNSGTGTIGDPFGDLQYALDTVGAGVGRNATDGDQFNIKAGTAEILAASLTLATYGTPTSSGPLILRGYTAAANDGGMGEIDCGGFTMWAATTYVYIVHVDLELHSFGNNNGVRLDAGLGGFFRCEIHKGTSAPSGKHLVLLSGNSFVIGCYIHDIGDGNGRAINAGGYIASNYIVIGADADVSIGINGVSPSTIENNVIICNGTGTQNTGISGAMPSYVVGNVVYSTVAGTYDGIRCANNYPFGAIVNNIIVGFSGVGGNGIEVTNQGMVGYNAFYNNTINVNTTDMTFVDLTANDVALAADPFTSAATGDFSLTAAAKTALASKGFPLSYLGAHANTVSNLNIGPIQLAATAGGGAPRISPLVGRLGG